MTRSVISLYLEQGRNRFVKENIDTIYAPEGTFIGLCYYLKFYQLYFIIIQYFIIIYNNFNNSSVIFIICLKNFNLL